MTSLHTLFSKRTAQLAFIAVAGVASVSAGSAQALSFAPQTVNGFTFTPLFDSASGSAQILADGVNKVRLLGTFSPAFTNGAELFRYTVTAPTGTWFSKVTLDTFAATAPTFVTKSIASGNSTIATLTSDNFTTSGALMSTTPIPGMVTSLTITDTYFAATGGNLVLLGNSFEAVPGPVPVLGAAAFFGYSRKLRNRIKASKAQTPVA